MISGRAQPRRYRCLLKAMFWLAGVAIFNSSTRAQEIHSRQPESFRGSGSCSATACHGSTTPSSTSRILRNESTTWQTLDKHANAFSVLGGEQSKTIIKRLGSGWKSATEESRCLACHATVSSSARTAEEQTLVADGVGCESCHGPASDWISPHTQFDWAAVRESRTTHFRSMTDLTTRAKTCAGCHVGEPAKPGQEIRDVDHNLIAAGHPRLDFEFSAYLANMPPHWGSETVPDVLPDFRARTWALGQVVSAQVALELLADRAVRTVGGQANSWPEFAEYGCFSCHHDLRDEPWRRNRKRPHGSKAGELDWGSWTYSLLETLGIASESSAAKAGLKEISRLRESMTSRIPDQATIALEAKAAAKSLDPWIAELAGSDLSVIRLEAIAKAVAEMAEHGGVLSWDMAAQNYLAQVPLYQSISKLDPSKSDPERLKDFERIRDYLRVPDGYQSPKGNNPTLRQPKRP